MHINDLTIRMKKYITISSNYHNSMESLFIEASKNGNIYTCTCISLSPVNVVTPCGYLDVNQT